ncbi:hypothetical protein OESDEN_10507, partial [Oesophagostomum dentatum]
MASALYRLGNSKKFFFKNMLADIFNLLCAIAAIVAQATALYKGFRTEK